MFLAALNMSIAAGILLALVLILRQVMRRYAAAGFRYLLWIPFLFRLLVPYALPSIFSVYNLFHRKVASPNGLLLTVVYLDSPTLPLAQDLLSGQAQPEWNLLAWGCVIWAIGAIGILIFFAIQYLRIRLALRVSYRVTDDRAAEWAAQAGLRRVPQMLYTDAVQGPMVFGILRPQVLLPLRMKDELADRRYILLHEFSHIRCWDHGILLMGCVALALHWFNPLVWIARNMMARDIECACDQRVLRCVGVEEQLNYAQTLVDWANQRRFGLVSYAAFGERDVTRRVKGVLTWRRLPGWAEKLLACLIVCTFLCTATNPMLPDRYLPQSSPFVLGQQRKKFQQAAYRLENALETGDGMQLAAQASMDPAYFAELYDEIDRLSLQVNSIRLYCNSNTSAELYMNVTVKDKANVFEGGEGVLVAHLTQTDYRPEPFVDILMPRDKYESMRLADTNSEAARLALRLCANLEQPDFEADTLSPVTVARVCMASAIEDKEEMPPFSAQRMQQLAEEYFALKDFSCTDPAVYDAVSGTYFYEKIPQMRMCVTRMEQLPGENVRVAVECYEDPMCLYPLWHMECQMQKTG